MESIFRYLVVATAALTVLFWAMPYFDYMWFSDEQLNLLDQNGLGAVILGNDFIYWGTLLIWLALSVGLFFYLRFARVGFIAFYVLSLGLGLFYGVQVLTPYESTISSLIGLADGAIIAIAYLTSVGGKFAKNS
jgi:hypothetical protein